MRVVSADDLARTFTFPKLIEALREGFRGEIEIPVRHHHAIERPDEPAATLLLMPAWTKGAKAFAGVKVLTLWRTAAASALAATYLAREDAHRMVMVGAGALAPYLVQAHASVRPIDEVLVWNRSRERAERIATDLRGRGYTVAATEDLEAAVRTADLISCATLSSAPLIEGAWLKPGAHLDLVGGFTPKMREADDEAVRRARVFVDTRAGALKEAGDIVQPLANGILREGDIGDLFDLCRGKAKGRAAPDEITLFKSVGTALEDLTAAMLAVG